ncbi:MAG: hypothetical protein AAF387_05590 [Pseudomonadota bacterium]
MLGAVAQAYECQRCGRTYRTVIRSAIAPLLAISFSATHFWAQVISHYTALSVASYCLGFLATVISFLSLTVVVFLIAKPLQKPNHCEDCGESMLSIGCGPVEAPRDSIKELLVYAAVLAMPLVYLSVLSH